jgi:hypothetical protein
MLERTETVPKVGFRLLTSEVVDLTPGVVMEFRSLEPTSTERELNPHRVDHLSTKADHGLLVTFHWVTAAVAGKIRRVNGMHSSTMLANRCMTVDGKLVADGSFPEGMKVHREHFECDDGDALAMLFRQFDDRVSGRSPLDISGVYQGLHSELANVNRKIGKLAVDGYAWFQRNVEKVPNTPIGDDVYGTFNNTGLYPMIQWLNTLFAVKCAEMKYPPVVAAIVGTYITNESAARDFWQTVVNLPNGDDESTPASVLTNWLLAIQAKKIDRPNPANLYQGCIYAWNAYRADKSITTIRDDIKKNFFTISE